MISVILASGKLNSPLGEGLVTIFLVVVLMAVFVFRDKDE